MSRIVLDLVEGVNRIATGSSFEVPVKADEAHIVGAWCERAGHELISVHNGLAVIRRGPAPPPQVLPVPRLWVYTNFDCNLACDYCCASSSPQAPRRAIGRDAIARLATQAAEAGIAEILLTGGEPFLLLDLDEIVQDCVARLPTTVLTNGMLFRGRRLDMLRRMPRNEFRLQISLDSASPDRHDRHRGPGTWHKAMEGIRIALAEGFRVRVAATVAPGEDRDEAALHVLLDELAIAAGDRIIRPVAARGFANEGVAVQVESVMPEVTVTAEGVYWHPVGADHPDQLVTRDLFPLRRAIDEVRRRFAAYRQALGDGADRFPCA